MNNGPAIQLDDEGLWESITDLFRELAATRAAAGDNARLQALNHLQIPQERVPRTAYFRRFRLNNYLSLPIVEYRMLWRRLRTIDMWVVAGHLWHGFGRLLHTLVVSVAFYISVGWLVSMMGQEFLAFANLVSFSNSVFRDFKTYLFGRSPWAVQHRAILFDHKNDPFYAIPDSTSIPSVPMLYGVMKNLIVLDLDMTCTAKDVGSECTINTGSLIFKFDRAVRSHIYLWLLHMPWLVSTCSVFLFLAYVTPPTLLLVNMAYYVAQVFVHRLNRRVVLLLPVFKAAWRSVDA